jgi:hypothetical protein
MAIRLLIGAILAAIVMFVWGGAFWMVLATQIGFMRQADPDVLKAMVSHEAESGEYFYPMPVSIDATPDDRKAAEEKTKAGPLMEISFRNEGVETGPLFFATGFGHLLALGIIAGFLLTMAVKGLPTYLSRVGFVLLLGILASAAIDVEQVVWMHHPWRYPTMLAIYHVGSWLLAGIVLGAIIRPPREAKA